MDINEQLYRALQAHEEGDKEQLADLVAAIHNYLSEESEDDDV